MGDTIQPAALPAIRVALFAHNEERTITRSLGHLLRESEPFDDFEVRVLINGCTDRTPAVVKAFAESHPGRIVAHELPVGDKAATWNAYLYDVSRDDPADCVHVFMDADIWPEPASLEKMSRALMQLPEVSAIGGLPMCGRNRDRYRQLAINKHLIYGGIYATRGAWLDWARGIGFRIPEGVIADDAILTNAFTTLPDNLRKSNLRRVHHLPDCGYRFTPIRPWKPADLRLYLRRLVRYRLAGEQLRVMGWRWPDEMPSDAHALNQTVLAELDRSPRRHSLVDYLLKRQLRKRYGCRAA